MIARATLAGLAMLSVGSGCTTVPPQVIDPTVAITTPTADRPHPMVTLAPATAVSTATVAPLVVPTIVPAPNSPTPAPRSPTAQPRRADVRKQIEAAMQAVAPEGSAQVIADSGALVASYRAAQPRTAASTIKLPLLVEVLRQAEIGKLDLSRRVTIRPADVVAGTGDLQHQVGRTLTLQQIVEHMVLYSDNVAANILVDIVGMSSVNATAHANDFPDTFFRRRMLDTGAQAAGVENLTSAADLARMFDGIVRGTLVTPWVSQQALRYLDERGRIDKNWLGLKLTDGAQLSHISGTLAGVRNDVGLIASPSGKTFVLALCQDHLTSEASGEAAIADLARRVLDILDAG